jgi:hypothetical protein
MLMKKTRRLFASAIAKTYGHGGTGLSHSITGLHNESIKLGVDQLIGRIDMNPEQQGKKGGGRKKLTEIQPDIKAELEKLVAPDTKGDPESPLL